MPWVWVRRWVDDGEGSPPDDPALVDVQEAAPCKQRQADGIVCPCCQPPLMGGAGAAQQCVEADEGAAQEAGVLTHTCYCVEYGATQYSS